MKHLKLSLAAFNQLGRSLGRKSRKQPLILGLIGPLGAGKTTFVQAFAKGFGSKKVKSPSFVIMHHYASKPFNFYHLDLYRLKNSKQLIPLGLDELFSGENVLLIEWADKFPKLAKSCDKIIKIGINKDQTRNVSINNN